MSDPLRTDGARALDAASDADRDAKIEQLLLDGLDHYFAAQHEQAINVWTRALFLDRSHARARAYIERARSALAERQRQSEELLHNGVAAFQRGEGAEARRLIEAAIGSGAPPDEALAVLVRLDRREQALAPQTPGRTRGHSRGDKAAEVAGSASRTALGLALSLAVLLAVAIGAAYAAANRDHLAWRSLAGVDHARASSAPVARAFVLPIPRRGELALIRARRLMTGGHLHDALAALDAVRPTDRQKSDADRLRADIQHQLLGLLPPAGAPGDGRVP